MEALKRRIKEEEEKVKALRNGAVTPAAEISPGKSAQRAAEQRNGDELIQPTTLQADVPGQDVATIVHAPRPAKAEDDNKASNSAGLQLAPVLTKEPEKEENGDRGGCLAPVPSAATNSAD